MLWDNAVDAPLVVFKFAVVVKIAMIIHRYLVYSGMAQEADMSALGPAIRELERAAAKGPLHAAVLTRATRALSRAAVETDSASLGEVAAASTDLELLLGWLVRPESLAALIGEDTALKAARLRGLKARARLVQAAGGLLSVAEVAAALGLSRQAVDKRRRAGRLLALSFGRRGYLYPALQFENGEILPGFAATLDALKEHDSWMSLAFLVNSSDRLGGDKPIERLRLGEVSTVVEDARMFGEQVAD